MKTQLPQTYTKYLSCAGKEREVKAQVIATVNFRSEVQTGYSSMTHDDYKQTVYLHRVQAFIDNVLFKEFDKINSESELLKRSKELIELTEAEIKARADRPKVKPFSDEMSELFK